MNDTDKAEFKKILAENGYSLTKARLAVFSLLFSDSPQSIREIVESGKGLVDRVSIYRNIEVFEKIGIVHRIYIGWKYKIELSDTFLKHHHHMVCLKCGKVFDIGDEKHIDEFIERITAQNKFTPRKHIFEIDGWCEDCRDKN